LTDWDPDDVEANWNTGQSSGDVRIKSDGTAWGWGYNRWGKNGTGDITHYSSPIQLGSGDTDWAKVRNGNNSTAIIKSDNTLWRCGYNNWGEMGHGDQTHKSSPVQVAGAYDDVAIGDSHMVALKTDGTLWACGWNYAGTIGQGNTTNYSTLQQIGSDTDWDRISVIGYSGTIAVKTNGQVYYAGKNEEGQAGNGAATNLSTLIAVGVADEWEVTNQRYRTFSRGRSWIKA
jgi:alpha-tubulin suppressor-like RCC1 family protein